jgi:hypothetical protein
VAGVCTIPGKIRAAHLRAHALNAKINPVSGNEHGDIRGGSAALMSADQRPFDILCLDITPCNEGPRLNNLFVHV